MKLKAFFQSLGLTAIALLLSFNANAHSIKFGPWQCISDTSYSQAIIVDVPGSPGIKTWHIEMDGDTITSGLGDDTVTVTVTAGIHSYTLISEGTQYNTLDAYYEEGCNCGDLITTLRTKPNADPTATFQGYQYVLSYTDTATTAGWFSIRPWDYHPWRKNQTADESIQIATADTVFTTSVLITGTDMSIGEVYTVYLEPGETVTITPASGSIYFSVFFCPDLGSLPINLESFSGRATDQKTVELEWRTSLEINNDYMKMERSGPDGNFVAIGRVEGRGFASTYTFVDQQPLPGLNFYRLKQFDVNGDSTVHRIIDVTVIPDYIKVLGNGLSDNPTIEIEGIPATGLRVTDDLGRELGFTSNGFIPFGTNRRVYVEVLPGTTISVLRLH